MIKRLMYPKYYETITSLWKIKSLLTLSWRLYHLSSLQYDKKNTSSHPFLIKSLILWEAGIDWAHSTISYQYGVMQQTKKVSTPWRVCSWEWSVSFFFFFFSWNFLIHFCRNTSSRINFQWVDIRKKLVDYMFEMIHTVIYLFKCCALRVNLNVHSEASDPTGTHQIVGMTIKQLISFSLICLLNLK